MIKVTILAMMLGLGGCAFAQQQAHSFTAIPNSPGTPGGQSVGFVALQDLSTNYSINLVAPNSLGANFKLTMPTYNNAGSPACLIDALQNGVLSEGSCAGGLTPPITFSGSTAGYILTVTQSGAGGALDINGTSTFTGLITASGGVSGAVGATGPSTGAFTTLSASSTVSGAGFTAYLASPPPIGSSAPNTGNFSAGSAATALNVAATTSNNLALFTQGGAGTAVAIIGGSSGVGLGLSATTSNNLGLFTQSGNGNGLAIVENGTGIALTVTANNSSSTRAVLITSPSTVDALDTAGGGVSFGGPLVSVPNGEVTVNQSASTNAAAMTISATSVNPLATQPVLAVTAAGAAGSVAAQFSGGPVIVASELQATSGVRLAGGLILVPSSGQQIQLQAGNIYLQTGTLNLGAGTGTVWLNTSGVLRTPVSVATSLNMSAGVASLSTGFSTLNSVECQILDTGAGWAGSESVRPGQSGTTAYCFSSDNTSTKTVYISTFGFP